MTPGMRSVLGWLALVIALTSCSRSTTLWSPPSVPVVVDFTPDAGARDPDAPRWVYRQRSVTQIADHQELVSLGLLAWPDSIVGFAHHPSGAIYGFAFGIDGDVMRASFTDDLGSITSAIRAPIGPEPPEGEWWGSGGPVYHHAPTGLLLMVTHDEDPDVTLRMAKSTDWGETWTDLGMIIDHTSPHSPFRYMGNGGFVTAWDQGVEYMYVYHADAQGPYDQHQVALARAPLAQVVLAALEGRTPEFRKWNGVDFSEPGLGGASVDLIPDHTRDGVVGDFDPYYVEALGMYVAFYPSQIDGAVDPPTWNVYQVFSEDGIHWSRATKVYPEDLAGGDPIYIGVHAHNRVITDHAPRLVRLRCTDDDDRWGSSTLELVTLELVPAGDAS